MNNQNENQKSGLPEESAEERKAKLKAEKDARFKEVIEAYKHADALRDAVVEDYGYFTYETEDDVPSIWELFFQR